MTYEELLQAMLGRVPSNVDKREGSIIYDALAPCAYFLAQQNFQLENYLDLVFPDTAVGEYLDRAVAAFGVTRKPASAAVRKMITTGAVPIGSRWGLNSRSILSQGNWRLVRSTRLSAKLRVTLETSIRDPCSRYQI